MPLEVGRAARGFILSSRSLQRLQGVHPDLVRVVKRAITITPLDFMVLEGLRTAERQAALVATGASRTLNSRHLTGHAVDLGVLDGGEVSWHWPHYVRLAAAMKAAAAAEDVPIIAGADWKKFRDGPHYELPRGAYPA